MSCVGRLEVTLRQHAPHAERIGLETGPLTTWLWTELTTRGLPMVCLDARHAQRALEPRANKTDANDAEGLAHIVVTSHRKPEPVRMRRNRCRNYVDGVAVLGNRQLMPALSPTP